MKRAISSREWAALRRQVFDRDNGSCVVCGKTLDPDWWECHHRRYRSRGGRNELCNLVAVCPNPCHLTIHSRSYDALAVGWAVSRYGAGPELVPVLYADGCKRLLTNDIREAA